MFAILTVDLAAKDRDRIFIVSRGECADDASSELSV
jgi:hypothetical protein